MKIDKIKQNILNIKDPDIGATLADLNAINITNNPTTINLTLPGPTTYLHNEYQRIISAVDSSLLSNAILSITETTNSIKNRPDKLNNIKYIIAISSGKGGVGKSTIASCIACELAAQGASVGILDGDIYGPSQPIMLGVENDFMEAQTDQHGNTIAFPAENYGIKIASIGFVLNRNTSAMLRGPKLAQVFNLFVDGIEWGALDFLIVDLPPGTGDIHINFANKLNPDGVVLITTPQDISLADVRRGADLFRQMKIPILGIVENMSYFVPPDLPDKKYFIFGEGGAKNLAVELNLSVLGEVPFSIKMREDSDAGRPIVIDKNGGHQKEILKDITANIVSELRRIKYNN
jgi:ATP-binding protein involved in chromosome partitioning